MFWQFVGLLAVHWVADFVLQTHWQASNKSRNGVALSYHVVTYTIVLGIATVLIFRLCPVPVPFNNIIVFISLNGALHLWTDYATSRINSKLFMKEVNKVYANYSIPGNVVWDNFNLHNFFVMIGFDQLIHNVTLAATMWWLLSYSL